VTLGLRQPCKVICYTCSTNRASVTGSFWVVQPFHSSAPSTNFRVGERLGNQKSHPLCAISAPPRTQVSDANPRVIAAKANRPVPCLFYCVPQHTAPTHETLSAFRRGQKLAHGGTVGKRPVRSRSPFQGAAQS